jgi:hypothetical protein
MKLSVGMTLGTDWGSGTVIVITKEWLIVEITKNKKNIRISYIQGGRRLLDSYYRV